MHAAIHCACCDVERDFGLAPLLGVEALIKPQQNIQFAHLALTFVLVVVALRFPPYARRSGKRTTSSAPTAERNGG